MNERHRLLLAHVRAQVELHGKLYTDELSALARKHGVEVKLLREYHDAYARIAMWGGASAEPSAAPVSGVVLLPELAKLGAEEREAISTIALDATRALIEEGAVYLRDGRAAYDEELLDEACGSLPAALGRAATESDRATLRATVDRLLASKALRASHEAREHEARA